MDFLHSHKENPANAGSNESGNELSHGSKNLKHQRSGISEDIWKLPKMPRVDEVDFNTMKKGGGEIFGRSDLWTSGADDGQKMLSFSSNSEPNRCSRNIAFSIYQDENNRVNGGGFNEAMMRSPFARLKGPFTPSQWMELEIQALIYKHFVANVPVPSNLLMPIKKSLYSYGPHASYPSNFRWGPFHLGYSGSNDPEPGRCRRTDGKKWRCSRDAVPDQKYCERHINRGRHRSRKPVEGQSGQAVPGSATTTNTDNKVEPIAPSSSSASVISSRGASSSLGAMQLEQYNSLQQQQHNTGSAFIDHLGNRTQGFQGIPLTTKIDMKSTEVPFSIRKEQLHLPPFEDSSQSMFGLVTSDALVNPSERISYMTNSRDSDSFIGFNEKETSDRHPVHHFMDDWPKDHHNHPSDHPKELKSDWTQLSMSIPDFSSSSTSPVQEKASEIIPTLSLSHEWGNSMGGPLGEVLTSTTSTPHGLSPTGVLQKSTLFTLSNSSSGSKDDVDNNAPENANLFNVFGSTRVSSTVDSSY